jgi:hypothetical protein
MAELALTVATPRELVRRIWEQVSSPEVRPFLRLFVTVFALTRADLSTAWIDDAWPWPTRWAARPTRPRCAWASPLPWPVDRSARGRR